MPSALDRKIAAILKAGKEQLPPEEYQRLGNLIYQLRTQGINAYLNSELGLLMSRIAWSLPEYESKEYSEGVMECDRRYLGTEMRLMYRDMGIEPPRLAKKEMAEDLYKLGQPDIVAVVDSYLENVEKEEEGGENAGAEREI
ncbi:MAG: hypothetical protein PHU23_05960 [Dehalococcoidales bacterium]|nr:hypothetical protein [Dehalococcoidales bacterium]